MRSTPLESRTIRPGLMAYSSYASNRRPVSRAKKPKLSSRRVQATGQHYWPVFVGFAVVVGLVIGFKSVGSGSQQPVPVISGSAGSSAAAAVAANECVGNGLAQLIKVSINQRHLWACQGSKAVYDSPVVTGMEHYAADKTPVGTYHISDKITNITLTGSDSTGAWSDPVQYWMPFLSNQFGAYGFHDAPWRPDSAFGKIDPNSNQASHGCVELPLAASKWLYNWAQVGTTVTIQG